MPAYRTFVVVPKSIDRCGSTWFCQLLDSHPRVACLHEVFNPDCAANFAALHAEVGAEPEPARLFAAIAAQLPGRDWYGFKLFERHVGAERTARLLAAVDLVLLIDRQNLMRAVASWLVSARTQTWQVFGERAAKKARRETIAIDVELARSKCEWAVKCGREMQALVRTAGTPHIEITYESLVADCQGMMQRVFAALQLPPAPVRAKVVRIHPDASYVRNAIELDQALGARFGYLLEAGGQA